MNKNGLAFLLIGCGALILLGKLGIHFGWLFSYLIPLAMVLLGYTGIRNGSKFWGWVLIVVGIICLLGKLSGLIGLLFAAGLIVYGVSMLGKRSSAA